MQPPEELLELRMLTVGDWQENCYLLVDRSTNEAVLFDPGDEAGRILAWMNEHKIALILLTHAHRDHIGALSEVHAKLGVPVGLHPGDTELAAAFGVQADFTLEDGQEIQVGRQTLHLVHTPGHTPGSMSVRFDRRVLVGDAIFPGGPGHTASPEDLNQSLATLQRTVFTWPDETELFPGHGRSTTVGRERAGFEAFLAQPRPPDLYGDVNWEVKGA